MHPDPSATDSRTHPDEGLTHGAWSSLYSFVILPVLWTLLHVVALVNPKVRRGIRGRKDLFESLKVQVGHLPAGSRIWFHSSSMGEFEQARPIIAALRQQYVNARIIVTFFSPSGYEHSRARHLADVVSYLPFDTKRYARHFLDLVRPDVAVMVRYDIWPNHIWELRKRRVPVLVANATMRRTSRRRFPLVRAFHRDVFNAIDEILTVTPTDAEIFQTFALRRPVIRPIGDTRFDQVSIRSEDARRKHILSPSITAGKKVVVAGSSWPEDEQVLLPAFLSLRESFGNLLLIIVPHEPTLDRLEDLEGELAGMTSSIRFSDLNDYNGEQVIIVDSIGILLILYSFAHIAYVGGSFRQGIHNVLEAAVYGIPVLFGPRHRNSQEPLMLVERGGGFVVSDTAELIRTLRNLLEDETARTTAGERAATFVQSNTGATKRFLENLMPYLDAHRPTSGAPS